ncbi:TRAM domain-containing protein [Haladaptatus cibarius]|uniref:TRAM domain-containing protein n=1 Tax=Haladaptatus cibarius TaxID=453847 RepID=UPI00067976A0|nr:TRAM domain-containing protein [Haladaptatus cibarius]
MPDCPLADSCPSFEERISGMGCHHYGDRGGAEWCNHYNQPIRELKTAPVQPGEEVVVEIDDIHESGSGVGRTDNGFIVLVDGILPDARAKVKITNVKGNHAIADPIERLPMEPEDEDESEDDTEASETTRSNKRKRRERLGSRDNFWGG